MPPATPRFSGLAQPIIAGVLAAVVGFASSFAVVLQGFAAMGATPGQAASGLMALCLAQGLLGLWLSLRQRMPIVLAWSTPGAALLAGTGTPEGGFAVACGAFLVAGLLILAAGLWRPFGRAVSAIPASLANAMLAGVLLGICLAPMQAVGAMPALALPVVLVWALCWRWARLWAVPAAVAVTALLIGLTTPIPSMVAAMPRLEWLLPRPEFGAAIGIGLPLFLVTMASQNVPGLAVLNSQGFRPAPGPIFAVTGAISALIAFLGAHSFNLAAITAALCAGPDAHPDPARRWVAAAAAGVFYVVLGLGAGFAAAFIAASPPLLIQAVAGLALLGALGGALTSAMAEERNRLAATLTFATTASGLALFGIGAAFWGLLAGGGLMLLDRIRYR
ncbi:benzoate/H(+) symporter BenE family transporter [Teichococcus vastitatis]|uniref:Benzoate/H(+) symporter BenE family transporter n=1 Tax=Teichococcus vastitatis TaxID=2307076 RepID=A0ABS9W2X9_9PROT|nr:benzoate/H(+) symporter BenE family transporter [Pseudoroseomonas vastitatis]MCI0753225.1 benzoate/H(+) symporter BenE family transporter [Pseudoroseomonas vastitatis]